MQRIDLLFIAALLAVLLLIFPLSAFLPENLLASKDSDLITQYLPHQIFIRHSLLEEGCIPFWNPYECSGTPAFPNPLYPTLSFPHILLNPLPPPLALNMGFFLHIFLGGIFMYAYARRIGCSAPAAFLGGIIFSLCARSLSHAHAGLYTRMIFYSYIPIVFFFCEGCLSRPDFRSSSLLAVSLTLALMSGEIQFFIYLVPFLLLYAMLRSATSFDRRLVETASRRHTDTPTRRYGFAFIITGLLLAAPLSAFYILPAWNLQPLLTRSQPIPAEHFSFMPTVKQLNLLFNPLLLNEFSPSAEPPWESQLYIGLAPLLIIIAMIRGGRKRDLLPWGILGSLTLILSLRELSFFHALLNRIIPPLGLFRNPGRVAIFFPFFAAALSAKGLDALNLPLQRPTRRRAIVFWLCVIAFVVLILNSAFIQITHEGVETLAENYLRRFGIFFGEQQIGYLNMDSVRAGAIYFSAELLSSIVFQFFLILPLCIILILREKGRIGGAAVTVILIAFSCSDLCYFGKRALKSQPLTEIFPPSPIPAAIQSGGRQFRLLDSSTPLPVSFWTDFPFAASGELKISRVDGYTPVNLSSYVNYLDRMTGLTAPFPRWSLSAPKIRSPQLLSLLNTKFIISESPLTLRGLELVAEFHDVTMYRQFLGRATVHLLRLYQNAEAMPRAWLVSNAAAVKRGDEPEKLKEIDPRDEVLVPEGSPTFSGGEPYRPVPFRRHAPNLIEIEVETSRPSYLCLSEIWAPGWCAEVGGVSREVIRVNGIFRGVFLQPGRHSLRIYYTPPGFFTGLAITGVGVLMIFSVVIVTRLRKG